MREIITDGYADLCERCDRTEWELAARRGRFMHRSTGFDDARRRVELHDARENHPARVAYTGNLTMIVGD